MPELSLGQTIARDLTSVAGQQLKSLLNSPSSSNWDLLSLPGTHRHTPLSSLMLACWSQDYLKTSVEFLLDLMTQWEIAGRAFLCGAEPGRSLAERWLKHMQLSGKCRGCQAHACHCCWRTTWARAECPWPCYGQRGRPGQQHHVIPAEQSLYFLSMLLQSLDPRVTLLQGKNLTIFQRWPKNLFILFTWKKVVSVWLQASLRAFQKYTSKVFFAALRKS